MAKTLEEKMDAVERAQQQDRDGNISADERVRIERAQTREPARYIDPTLKR